MFPVISEYLVGEKVSLDARRIGSLAPRREYYKASRQPAGRVDIRHSLNEDLYVNFAGMTDGSSAVMEAYLFPLVNWIWIGALVVMLGTGVALVPCKSQVEADDAQAIQVYTENHRCPPISTLYSSH